MGGEDWEIAGGKQQKGRPGRGFFEVEGGVSGIEFEAKLKNLAGIGVVTLGYG